MFSSYLLATKSTRNVVRPQNTLVIGIAALVIEVVNAIQTVAAAKTTRTGIKITRGAEEAITMKKTNTARPASMTGTKDRAMEMDTDILISREIEDEIKIKSYNFSANIFVTTMCNFFFEVHSTYF